MIRHIVMFRWKPTFTDEIREQWVAGLERLPEEVPGLISLSHGPDVLHTAKSWDHVIIADFAAKEDIDVYNSHPAHEAIKPFSLPNVEQLAYVDFEL